MHRELPLFDALVPSIFWAFLLSVVIQVLVDRVMGWCGVYRYVWHPQLFRVSVFVCILGVCGLLLLR